MKNKDLTKQQTDEILQQMNAAIAEGNTDAYNQAFTQLANTIQENILEEYKLAQSSNDSAILAQRGLRQLTAEETNYYQKVISAMKSDNPKQAVTNIDDVLPKTVIDDVFEDLTQKHELLDVIDFKNTGAVTEWLMNGNASQLATWSPLCAEIVKELTTGFKKVDLTQNKLSAFLPICKAMLDLGPVWLDKYVREVLSEALYTGLEEGILNGKGQTANLAEPIGMRKNMTAAVDPTKGYADKAKVTVKKLDPITYGELIADLAVTENGNYRVVREVILVVNPVDYLKKVMPATTVRGTDGLYRDGVFPFPTKVIESVRMAEGEVIIGLGKRYFMGSGTGKSGKIEYSDHARFLEDERVYITKFYGHGQPKDNNSFKLLDITGLEPTNLKVEVIGEIEG